MMNQKTFSRVTTPLCFANKRSRRIIDPAFVAKDRFYSIVSKNRIVRGSGLIALSSFIHGPFADCIHLLECELQGFLGDPFVDALHEFGKVLGFPPERRFAEPLHDGRVDSWRAYRNPDVFRGWTVPI